MSCNKIDDKDVFNVIYPKKKNFNNKYDAIGLCHVKLEEKDTRNEDKCAFSQFKLSECDSIAAIIYSIGIYVYVYMYMYMLLINN